MTTPEGEFHAVILYHPLAMGTSCSGLFTANKITSLEEYKELSNSDLLSIEHEDPDSDGQFLPHVKVSNGSNRFSSCFLFARVRTFIPLTEAQQVAHLMNQAVLYQPHEIQEDTVLGWIRSNPIRTYPVPENRMPSRERTLPYGCTGECMAAKASWKDQTCKFLTCTCHEEEDKNSDLRDPIRDELVPMPKSGLVDIADEFLKTHIKEQGDAPMNN